MPSSAPSCLGSAPIVESAPARQGEDDVEVGRRQELGLPGSEPLGRRQSPGTSGSGGFGRSCSDAGHPAVFDMAAESRPVAGLYGATRRGSPEMFRVPHRSAL